MKTTLKTLQKHGAASIDAGFNTDSRGQKEPIFYYFGEMLPESYCDNIDRSIGHTGWYTNYDGTTYKDGSGKARGVVVELPKMPGFPDGRFLAGYMWGDNNERVLWPELYSDNTEAARAADSHAEYFADIERENNRKWNAARDIETAIDEKLTRLRECIALRHKACMDYVRGEIADICEAIRSNRETLETEYADYV
jgi:hypothetical protein